VSDAATLLSLLAIAATGPALALLNVWARRTWGGHTDNRHWTTTAILAVSTTLGVGLGPFAHGFLGVPLEPTSAFGGIVGAMIAWFVVLKELPNLVAPLRRDRVVARLRSPRTSRRTLVRVHRELRLAARSRDHDRYARELLRTVDTLCRAGFYEELLELLDQTQYDRINARGCRYLAVYGALAHMHLGQMDDARNVLDGIEGSLDGPWEEWRLAIDAITAAAVGRRREAKALASWIADDRYALERAVAEAHAFAAEGRRAEAQRTLMRVQAEHDDPALDSFHLVRGPASALARTLVSGKGSPFR
jgi:hypothetical protein